MIIDREEHLKQWVVGDIVCGPKPISLTLLEILKQRGIAPKPQMISDILTRLSLHYPVIRIQRSPVGDIWIHSD